MSHTDTQFRYISGNDSYTLSTDNRTAGVGDRSRATSASSYGMAARRSSSVASSRRYHVTSRDAGMAKLRWSTRWYSVQELVRKFNRRFPVLVRVEHGYCCCDVNELKLDVGQVLHIHGVCSVEKRVEATDSEGRTLSIPLDYPVSVKHAGSDAVKSLSSAINESPQLPFTVRCVVAPAPANHRSRDQLSALHGQQLTINELYDSTFLLANPIHSGWLDVADTVIIPDDLSARLSVAEGLIGASDDEWLDYCGMFARAARPVKLSQCTDYEGIYYKSPKQNPAEPPAACRGASDCRIDVQPHIISQRGGRPTHRPVGVPLESRLYHHTSVVSQSHDCLDVVRPSAIRRDAAKSQSSSALVVPPADNQRPSRRRRRPDVAETSFMELSSTERVQVDLPQRPTVLPVGKHAGPACHQKSSSGDNFDESVNALTTESGLGGSMPCLPSPGDDLAPDEDRVRDVLVPSALSTMSSSCQGTGLTSASAHSGVRTRSYHRLHHDDEGYLTKESNTSTSSVDTSRHSPVFF